MGRVEDDLARYEREQADEARKQDWLERQSDIIADEWQAELLANGRIDVVDLDEADLAVLMEERGLDRDDTINILAFEYCEKSYERCNWN